MDKVTVAATQMSCSWNTNENLDKAESLIREAKNQGAEIILLQELYETPYFCAEQKETYFSLAKPFENHPIINNMATLARDLKVVLPISFFEKEGQAYFNAIAIIDADGKILGRYRKSHIPDGPGYQEKFYFNPGDTGFMVWKTRYAPIGVGICWDQWYPECARAMVLQGAEILFYPTAIGTDPMNLGNYENDRSAWTNAMQGHAASNAVPVVASNRIGTESWDNEELTFWGSSFITDTSGIIVEEASRETQQVISATLSISANQRKRAAFGFFRDRRADLYAPLMTLSGKIK
jgi:N-carbamoylputrescine amidase